MVSPALALLLVAATAGEPPPAEAPPPGAGAACPAGDQVILQGLGTPEDDLLRLAELSGATAPTSGMIRGAGVRTRTLCAGAAPLGWLDRLPRAPAGDRWVMSLPVRLGTTWNSTYPSGGNDGLLWSGRGLSTLLSAGVTARWGPLSATVAPEVTWQQNAWFETVPTGQGGDLAFASPWYGGVLDLYQRPGAGPHAAVGLGQSELTLEGFGVRGGLSTADRWLGPGVTQALLLTNNAPGLPQLFLGTARPVDIWIGNLEVLALWGRPTRSRWFVGGEQPWFSALALTYEPRWTPGLTFGLGRAFMETPAQFEASHGLAILKAPLGQWMSGGNSPGDNQIVSGWVRWVLPEAGLELFGEWGREDFPLSFEGLVREPDHSQAWTAGLQKLSRLRAGVLRVQLELSHLHELRPPAARYGTPIWYTHGENLGWSNAGQVMGAAAGPGSDTQRLAIDLLTPAGRLGGFLERTRRNFDVFWLTMEPLGTDQTHDAELALGARQVLFAGPLEVAWEASAAYRWSRDFLLNQPNLRVILQLTLPLGAWGSPGTEPADRPDPSRVKS